MKLGLFKKKDKAKEKNKKLTGDVIRLRVNRLINSTPVEIAVFDATLTRDENNNTIIFDEANNVKEEIPGLYDSLVSDVLYKLESRGLSREAQIEKVEDHNVLNFNKEFAQPEKVKVNIQTEKTKLRLLKCVKYTLIDKKGEGYYESIEVDGTRSLTYLIRDGDLIPYWHKTPMSEGEPIVLVPDIVQRKKFYKEASEETINDFNESQDTFWKGVLGLLTKIAFVVMFISLIVWTVHNARWSGELYDESLEPKLQQLELENQRIRQLCSEQLANQMENNGVLIDYAKAKIEQEKTEVESAQQLQPNIQI